MTRIHKHAALTAGFLLLASGLCMVPAIRSRLARASTWHSGFFVAAVALIVAHAVAGRL